MKNSIMKKTVIFAFVFGLALNLSAQFKLGVRAGMGTYDIQADEITAKDFGLAVKEANYGFHFGGFVRANLGPVFIQPEVLWNSNSVDFSFEDFGNGFAGKVVREKYSYLDVPVLVGVKLGPLRLNTGPVGHIFLNSKSDLADVAEYEQNFKDFTLGWQGGLGLDIWKLMLDFRYETNFSKFGDHIVVDGTPYEFDNRPGRLLFSVGFTF